MRLLAHPLHLTAIVAGAATVAFVLLQVDPTGQHFAACAGGLLALTAAVDLARRLGLEPKNDPATPLNRRAD